MYQFISGIYCCEWARRSEVEGDTLHFKACWVWDCFGSRKVVTGGWGFSECVSGSIQWVYSTSTLSSANHQSGDIPGLFGVIIRTAGAGAAARLRGGWERAPPRQTQEGLLHLLSCRPTHPQAFFFVSPPHTPVVHQLRAAGETAGLCCQGEDVFMSVSVEWSGGGAGPVTSLIHLNTCTHTHALFSSSSFGCTADVSQHFWN